MHEELGYIHLLTKGMWDQKRREKIKANQLNYYIINKSLMKKVFLRKSISIISMAPFISSPIYRQIYVQNCVLSSLKIQGLLNCQFTNAEMQSSWSETRRSLHYFHAFI